MPKPVFCPDCRQCNTFDRKPEKDMKLEGGGIFEKAWVCRLCGHKALEHVGEGDNNERKEI